MPLKIAQLFNSIEGSGYFIIMGLSKTHVKISPLFYCEKIIYFNYSIDIFKKYFKPFDYKNTNRLSNKIKARLDHKYMRRLNKL